MGEKEYEAAVSSFLDAAQWPVLEKMMLVKDLEG
jgi:hypothetical protein